MIRKSSRQSLNMASSKDIILKQTYSVRQNLSIKDGNSKREQNQTIKQPNKQYFKQYCLQVKQPPYFLKDSRKSQFKDINLKTISSFKSFDQSYQTFFKEVEENLEIAGNVLPYNEFMIKYEQIIKACIVQCEIQDCEISFINFITQITEKYKATLEIEVRILFLESINQQNSDQQLSLKILNKIKHIVIDTNYQFLLSKVFYIEAKTYEADQQIDLTLKSLQKCVQFSQNYSIPSYLKEKQSIRSQMIQILALAYFQLFKHKKQINFKEAQQYLLKAYQNLDQHFGQDNYVTNVISHVYTNQKNLRINAERLKMTGLSNVNKAITEISQTQLKNNMKINGFYLWEEQKLIVQLIKMKKYEKQIVQELEYPIKLDFIKIKQLKSIEWIQIINGELIIMEDQLLQLLEGNNPSKKQLLSPKKIGLKTISREQIIKRENISSSSSEDASFIQKQDFNFIRKLGRAQSAKKQQAR